MATGTRARRTPAKTMTVTLGEGGSVPKLIILGRGQLAARKLHAVRLMPETMDRLRGLVSGPDYLAIELAVRSYCDALEEAPETRVIRADDIA